jgi:hypothetical protein
MGGGRGKKMLENENIESAHLYINTVQCTINWQILEDHGDQERASHRRG